MMYLIYRAFQKLWIHRKTYFFIVLELAIGIAVVMCEICSLYSSRSRLELCKQQLGDLGTVIEWRSKSNMPPTMSSNAELAITVDDYNTVRDVHGDVRTMYLLFAGSIYLMQKATDVRDVTFVCMNDDMFTELFGFVPDEDVIYLGSQIADDSEQDELIFFTEWFAWGSDEIRIGELSFEKNQRLVSSTEQVFIDRTWNLDVDRMIVLPADRMKVLEENEAGAFPFMRVVPTVDNDGADTVSDIIRMLKEEHKSYSYNASEQYTDLKNSIADLTQDIRFFSWVAWFALIISMVGIVGILMIYMEKRKRELAIIIALGGTRTTIFMEIFIEIFSLSLIGGVISTIATVVIAPYLSTSVFTVSFHWISVAVMLGIVLMVSILSCLFTLLGIRSVKPMQILKG